MPKHICGADLGASMRVLAAHLGSRNLRHVADNSHCREPTIKTKRGAWRCRLHGGLSSGPKTAEGKARISAAARARWAAFRDARLFAEMPSHIRSKEVGRAMIPVEVGRREAWPTPPYHLSA
jgi:hypothetical protein